MSIKKVVLFLLFGFIFLVITDLNDILYSKLNSLKNDIKGIETRLNLHNYKVNVDAKEIKEVKKNLSGITYNKDTNTLFAISNSPRNIYELSLNGEHLRTIDLSGFKDTEGITYLEDGKFAIVDEKKQKVFVIKVDENTEKINADMSLETFTLKINTYKNLGYEGIAYDNKNKGLYIVNEKFPIELIHISNLFNKNDLAISFEDRLTSMDHFMDDFAGLHFDSNTRHLLFLSDESKSIAEVSLDGEQISFAELESGFLGLKDSIPQPEGITMDKSRNLYVVSEPNLFYSFKAQ